jgi:hypothetical protein
LHRYRHFEAGALRAGRIFSWIPERGIAVGERWEGALNQAINRCEAVLFLVLQPWLDSGWCLKEFNLAHRSNKRLFGVLIEDVPVVDLPAKPGHPILLF